MVIAVIAVRVVQVTGNDVVDVIVVLDDAMTAARSVDVSGVVAFTGVAF